MAYCQAFRDKVHVSYPFMAADECWNPPNQQSWKLPETGQSQDLVLSLGMASSAQTFEQDADAMGNEIPHGAKKYGHRGHRIRNREGRIMDQGAESFRKMKQFMMEDLANLGRAPRLRQ